MWWRLVDTTQIRWAANGIIESAIKSNTGIIESMLEKPELKDEEIINCLRNEFGLSVENISFLPLGADRNTSVYHVVANDGTVYFVKLRRGDLNKASIMVPKYLSDQEIKWIIPSITTQNGQLWANIDPFKVILYPFIEGHNAFEEHLSYQQWIEFGTTLKQFHSANIPLAITGNIQREIFSPHWRDKVMLFLDRIEKEKFDEPLAAELAIFLKNKKKETFKLVERSEWLAQKLEEQLPEFILCHADIHGWNLLIDSDGELFIVDWDTLIFAPKERDLMFIGGGFGDSGYTPQEEETMFYKGYGPIKINQRAIAYYRYECIIEDIAIYCEQILLSYQEGEDRKQALIYLKSNYLPNSTIERAYESDQALNDS
jgi:spectinomycin phosphotransferase